MPSINGREYVLVHVNTTKRKSCADCVRHHSVSNLYGPACFQGEWDCNNAFNEKSDFLDEMTYVWADKIAYAMAVLEGRKYDRIKDTQHATDMAE